MDWRKNAEKFFFGEDDSPEENCPPATGFYLGMLTSLHFPLCGL